MTRGQESVKGELLLIVPQKVPILPPVGPGMESRPLGQADGWLVETGSPCTVSSTRKTPVKVVSFLHSLDKTWLWSVLGAQFPP